MRFIVDIDTSKVPQDELGHFVDTMRDALGEAAERHITYTVPTPWTASLRGVLVKDSPWGTG